MPELLQEMYYGPNVQNLIESDDCKVMRLSDNSGEGMMTLYHVFPGVFLMYNDFHMKECISGFQTDMDLLCIDHCREGRIEQEVGQNAFSYLEAGDLRVDRRIHHSGKVEFPLCHYHGISIGFQVETAAKEIPAYMKGFSVDLYELQNKYCSDRTPYVIPGEPAIEHMMDEDHFLHLTDVGREVAEQIYEKHRFFTDRLIEAGVDPVTAEKDACRMEHVISQESFERLRDAYKTKKE